jgi:hypothetical protein
VDRAPPLIRTPSQSTTPLFGHCLDSTLERFIMPRTTTLGFGLLLLCDLTLAPAASAQTGHARLYRIPPLPQPHGKHVSVQPKFVTDSGVVAGTGTFFGSGSGQFFDGDTFEAFRWVAGSGEALELGVEPGGANVSTVFGVSDDGSAICGGSWSIVNGPILQDRPYRWTAATGRVRLPAIPTDRDSDAFSLGDAISADGSIVYGNSGTVANQRWAYWPDVNTARQFPTDTMAIPGYIAGVSADGTVVYGDGFAQNRALIWRSGALVSLILPGGNSSTPVAMTRDGLNFIGYADVVVSGVHHIHGFYYHQGGAMLDLGAPLWPTAAQDSVTDAISGDGSIILGTTSTDVIFSSIAWIRRAGHPTFRLADYFTGELGLSLRGLGDLLPAAISPSGRWIAGTAKDPSDQADAIGWLVDTAAPCIAEFTGDGTLNVLDFLAFLQVFAQGDARADLNGDGRVNTADFLAFLAAYASGC